MDPLLFRLVLMAAGLVVGFRGYSALKAAVALTGFLLGAHAVLVHPHLVPAGPPWLLPAAAVLAGLVLAVLVFVAYRLAVVLLGAAAFVLIALAFPQALPADPLARVLVLAAAALAGGLLARFLERVVLSLATAAYGAFMTASAIFSGVAAAHGRPPLVRDVGQVSHPGWFLAVWVALALAGAVFQLRPRR